METTDRNLAKVLDIDPALLDEGYYDEDDGLRDVVNEFGVEAYPVVPRLCSHGFRIGPSEPEENFRVQED